MLGQSIHIFYIPGLGDGYDIYRTRALKKWNKPGVTATLVPMRWTDRDETFEQKLRRIHGVIKDSTAERIVLVGESAGGSVVVAETLRTGSNVDKAITICGKNVRADRVSPRLYLKNPAFRASMQAADNAVAAMQKNDAKKFTIFYSKYDPVVWLVDTYIPGATLRSLPTFGHLASIGATLFLLRRRILKEAAKA